MTYPDTIEAGARRLSLLKLVLEGAEVLAEEAAELATDPERQDFRRAAEAGARHYAKALQADIDACRIDEGLTRKANLVARAAGCAGWLSASGMSGDSQSQLAMRDLVAEGVFAFYPAVPGQWVACYRLVAPAY